MYANISLPQSNEENKGKTIQFARSKLRIIVGRGLAPADESKIWIIHNDRTNEPPFEREAYTPVILWEQGGISRGCGVDRRE